MRMFSGVHLVLAVGGEAQIVALIVQCLVFVFMVNLHIWWGIHYCAMHKKRGPFAVDANFASGVKMAVSSFDHVPFMLGDFSVVGFINKRDLSFGEWNFASHNSL